MQFCLYGCLIKVFDIRIVHTYVTYVETHTVQLNGNLMTAHRFLGKHAWVNLQMGCG